MDMREKMARAMAEEDGYNPDDDGGIPGVKRWRSYLGMADAALSAMEEPTEAMMCGARDWALAKYSQGIGNDAATGCWRAMIRKAREG